MKTITNTLLIAALFTSNIVASHACIGTKCLATFGKPVAYKVTTSFKQNLIPVSTEEQMYNNIEQPLFQDNIVSDDETVEVETEITDNTPIIEVFSEDFTQPEEYDLEESEMNSIVVNNSIENIIETVTMDEDTKLSINLENIDLETICKENQELVSCDTISDSTECVCV